MTNHLDRPTNSRGRLVTGHMVVGAIFLALGILWTLDNLEVMDAERYTRWWPALLLGWGLAQLTGLFGGRKPIAGTIWTFVGAWLLLRVTGVVSRDILDFWPLALVLIGGTLVYRALRTNAGTATGSSDANPALNSFTFMAGTDRTVTSDAFRGGEVSVIMAGAQIDLRGSRPAGDRAVIDVFAFMGGIDLIVPETWRVVSEVTAVMGAFEDGTRKQASPGAPVLVVRGVVIMGGVEVKNQRGKDED